MGKASHKAGIQRASGMQGIRGSEKKGGEGAWGNMVAVSYLAVWITWLAQKADV